MAVTKTITFGKTGTRPYGVLTVTETATSTANNTSTLSIKLVLKRPSAISSSATKKASCTVNGTTYNWSGSIGGSGDLTLISKTLTVAHNSDGTKSINLSASITLDITWSGVKLGTISDNGSMTLTTIPRYASVSQSLSARTETTATMKWSSDSTVDYIWYSTNNGGSWTGINVADGKSGTYTINGLAANTTYQIKTRVRNKASQLTTDSSALSVTTYAFPYASSLPSFTIGERVTIGFYNPLGRSMTVNLIGADGSVCGTDTVSGTSISGYNNSTVQGRLYASIPNAKSGTYSVRVTYGGNVTTKQGGKYSVDPNVCSPSIGGGSYKDVNAETVAITGDASLIIQNKSLVQFTATGLEAAYSATISGCSVKVNGNTYNLTVSGTTATGGNAAINSGTDVEAVLTVTDSRGLTASLEIDVSMLELSNPTALISLQRQDNYYSETDITVDARYSSVNGTNTISIAYACTKDGDSAATVTGTLSDGVESTITLDNEYAWAVKVTITDRFGLSTVYNLSVSRGMPIIYFDRLKSSVGVNCFPNGEETLEVNGYNVELINSIAIANGTDFNSLTETKVYQGNATGGGFSNCPVSSGTFVLIVVDAGGEGQIMQELTTTSKTASMTYRRFYYGGSWGAWLTVSGKQTANCSIASGWENYNSGVNPIVRKDGNTVHINWQCKPTATVTLNATQAVVCTIPEGFRPSNSVYVLSQGTGTSFFLVTINTNGNVGVSRLRNVASSNGAYMDATASMWFPIMATWVI